MGLRHPSFRRLKHHRPYTTEELARSLSIHKNTVRRWMSSGLSPIDDHRPFMFRGIDVIAFLQKRRLATKQKCGPGELYCLKCRSPQRPAGGMADMRVDSPTSGVLIAICSACSGMLYRRVNPSKLTTIQANLEVSIRMPTNV